MSPMILHFHLPQIELKSVEFSGSISVMASYFTEPNCIDGSIEYLKRGRYCVLFASQTIRDVHSAGVNLQP